MYKVLWLAIGIALLGCACGGASLAGGSDEGQVRALFNRQIELGRDHNWRELYETYSTSYREQCSYSQFLDGMQAASARDVSFDNIGYHDLNIRLSGDSAYLTYVATYDGEDVSSVDSSDPDIYVREHGRWYDEVDSHTECD